MKPKNRFHIVLLGKLEDHSIRRVCQGAAEYIATRSDLDFEPWTVYPGDNLTTSIDNLNRADGLLITERDLRALGDARRRLRVPHVFVLANDRHAGTPAVGLDERAIGRMAAEHLIHRGYGSLAFFGCASLSWSALRGEGFRQTAEALGARVVEYTFPPATLPVYLSGRFAQRRYGLYQALRALQKPCGIFAAHDVLACYTIAAARAIGIPVPEQLGVVGVDDDPIANAAAGLAISTVHTPLRQIGWHAAEILDHLRRGNAVVMETVLPPVRIVVRVSTNAFMVRDSLVAQAQGYIEERRDKNLRVGKMARDLHTTVVTLHKHFVEHLKVTPAVYIRQRRMEYAAELLRAGDLSVKQICYACGFNDYSYFCHTFKHVTGVTPGSLLCQRTRRVPRFTF